MKPFLYLLCGLAGGLAGAAAFDAVRSEPPARAATEPRTVVDAGQAQALERLERRVEELAAIVADLRTSRAAAGTDTVGEAAAAPRRGPGGRPGAEGAADPGTATPDVSVDTLVRGLVGRKFGYNESGRLFNWLTANPDKVKDVIAALQREIEADPSNADLRVALATAHVAEIMSVPDGPQRGAVWMKAQAAYDKAIQLDPSHWQARYGKAFGISMAPEFLGMRPEAIQQFEDLRTMQEQGAPEPHHEQTYFRLGTLYKDAGNAEKAQEIWNEGLRRFPSSELLKGTLEVSTKK